MRNITLRQLKTIQTVASFGKINLAAKDLGLTAPAVTLQIQQLEQETGLPLFDRTREGMIITPAGRAVLEAARSIQERLEHLEDSIDSMKGLRSGRLRLGVVSTGKYFAPKLMAAFSKENPGIDMRLHVGNRAEIVRKLKNHEIDIALMGRPPRQFEVRSLVFGDHPLVFIAPADHPLANELDIQKERIAEEKFLVRENGSGTRVSLELFISDIPGRLENLGVEMDSNETIKQAVIAGLGIAFISAHTIEQEVKLKRLVILDVVDTPIRRQWFMVSRQDSSTTPAMAAFEAFIQSSGLRFLPIVPKPYPASVFSASATPQS